MGFALILNLLSSARSLLRGFHSESGQHKNKKLILSSRCWRKESTRCLLYLQGNLLTAYPATLSYLSIRCRLPQFYYLYMQPCYVFPLLNRSPGLSFLLAATTPPPRMACSAPGSVIIITTFILFRACAHTHQTRMGARP